jgi:hypothetical protein
MRTSVSAGPLTLPGHTGACWTHGLKQAYTASHLNVAAELCSDHKCTSHAVRNIVFESGYGKMRHARTGRYPSNREWWLRDRSRACTWVSCDARAACIISVEISGRVAVNNFH